VELHALHRVFFSLSCFFWLRVFSLFFVVGRSVDDDEKFSSPLSSTKKKLLYCLPLTELFFESDFLRHLWYHYHYLYLLLIYTMAPSAEKEYTLEQVAEHTKTESCWLIIGNEKNGEWKGRRKRRRLYHEEKPKKNERCRRWWRSQFVVEWRNEFQNLHRRSPSIWGKEEDNGRLTLCENNTNMEQQNGCYDCHCRCQYYYQYYYKYCCYCCYHHHHQLQQQQSKNGHSGNSSSIPYASESPVVYCFGDCPNEASSPSTTVPTIGLVHYQVSRC